MFLDVQFLAGVALEQLKNITFWASHFASSLAQKHGLLGLALTGSVGQWALQLLADRLGGRETSGLKWRGGNGIWESGREGGEVTWHLLEAGGHQG